MDMKRDEVDKIKSICLGLGGYQISTLPIWTWSYDISLTNPAPLLLLISLIFN
jgi:hypothetical protein